MLIELIADYQFGSKSQRIIHTMLTIIGEVVIRIVCSADSALFHGLGPTPPQPRST